MPNVLDRRRRMKLKKAFAMGYSQREAAKYAGCSPSTAQAYMAGMPFSCPCGRGYSQHKGLCSERFKRSPIRQEMVKNWKRGPRGRYVKKERLDVPTDEGLA